MTDAKCSTRNSIIELYSQLASNPEMNFGWDKGLSNAISHGYHKEWIEVIPESIWQYCAAVGNPFHLGKFNPGDSVLDIGCGAGIDLCVASILVGKAGRVTGVDLTPAMVELARHNAQQAGLDNITVFQGSIDLLPFDDSAFNIVISNGAINLCSHKDNVFQEIFRVLTPGGHLYFADMINIKDDYRSNCRLQDAGSHEESWADCVAGTLKAEALITLMIAAGFTQVKQVSLTHYKTSESTVGATFSAYKI
ncbi:MAG: methyltransferase domain-containing protein [Gammaproteobacteria bacterium]|nr:methyltransferase domain-containing protein [Gammaproteobacteria bacterium]